MNTLDIFIGVIVAFCLVRGIFRGIVKEVTSIVGVLVGFYAAYTYYPIVGNWFSSLITNKSYLNIASFFITFTMLFLAVGFVGVVLKHLLKSVALGWADRILGGIFGLVKAILIVSVLLVPLMTFLPQKSPVIKDSFLAPHVSTISEKMVVLVPKDMKQKFGDNINALKEAWKKL
jgi:membrane protein required for colicin V production